jgi:hypothetical protein
MLISLVAAAALATGGDPDGVVATARDTPPPLPAAAPVAPSVEGAAQAAVPHGLTTDQQIDRWLESRDPAARPYADAGAVLDDREPHGMLSMTVGTHGFREYGAAVSLPLGETGELNLSYRQVENGYRHYGYGDPWFEGRPYGVRGIGPASAAFDWPAARP